VLFPVPRSAVPRSAVPLAIVYFTYLIKAILLDLILKPNQILITIRYFIAAAIAKVDSYQKKELINHGYVTN
ncbi:hypothetical protein, partial [Moorena sp. SIO2C4]|uniref:hypothetical protein n=1 Tax=Moorena sp. SIO2C4 TaxID=2607824 RepID=UPI00257A4394